MLNLNSIIFIIVVPISYKIRVVKGGCDVSNSLGVSPTVELTTGTVQGLSCKTALDLPYFSYRGIPYAAPPLGALRFRAPRPIRSWKGVLKANTEAPACLQPWRYVSFPITYSEDCLFINVYTPHLKHPSGKLMPVIVWVHGGKFYQGSGSSYKYGPDFLLEKEVILVTFNFRLGVFGYLNMNVSEAQGNSAMKDKVAALKWVQREIRQFGGDPNSVTIFGGSSGAEAVNLLYLSPMAKGLFSRAISHSGSALCSTNFKDSTFHLGLQLAQAFGCTALSSKDIVACLQTVDAVELAEKQMILKRVNGLENPFVPTLETDLGEEPFLPAHPLSLIGQAPVIPYILGVNNGEALMYVEDPEKNPNQFVHLEDRLVTLLPHKMFASASTRVLQEATRRVQEFYFQNLSSLEDTLYGFIDYTSDKQFIYCVLKMAQLISRRAPVYLYYFTFEGDFQAKDHAYFKFNFTISGVCHGEELGYFFYRNYTLPPQNNLFAHPRDMNMVERVTSIWTNFARYGEPTPFQPKDAHSTWLPVKGNFTQHLTVGDVIAMVHSPLLEKRVHFWESLYDLVYSSLKMVQSSSGLPTITCLLLICTLLLGVIFVRGYTRRKDYHNIW